MMMRFVLFAVMLMGLTSCSLLTPAGVDNSKKYVLNTTPECVSYHKHSSNTSILVMPVRTTPMYDTTQMAYTDHPYQISYFAKNRWIETPGTMLQGLLVQTLHDTHYFRSVASAPSSGIYDYILNVQLIELQQQFMGTHSEIHLLANVQIIRSSTGQIMASKQFCLVEPAPQNTPYGGVVAANLAVSNLLRQIAYFSMQST